MEQEMKSEARLTFWEATGIIIGHGVGAGILSAPFMAKQNNWWDFIWIMALAYVVSLLLHLMIAELSYNNGGAMFVKCLENLFSAKVKKIITIIAGVCLGFSVISNCCAYISGGGKAVEQLMLLLFGSTFEGAKWVYALIFYIFCAMIVFFGMKVVGISEKICSFAMAGIMVVLTITTILQENHYALSVVGTPTFTNMLGLFGMLTFALSAVMSVPQVVKGLNGDKKKIRLSITTGITITALLIVVLTVVTIVTVPGELSKANGAITDISLALSQNGTASKIVAILGYLFSIFALATSFWANSLDLRDIVHEQTNLSLRTSWVIVSAPCLLLAIVVMLDFVSFTALAGAVQVITALGIVVAFHFSRKRSGATLIGKFGGMPFQVFILLFNLLASIGLVLSL